MPFRDHAQHTPDAVAIPPADSSGDLAQSLTPYMIADCNGQLDHVEWFRSTWQAGGASTAKAVFTDEDGIKHDAIVKLPVGPTEYRWSTRMGMSPEDAEACPTPKVFASGTTIGPFDLAWIVFERIHGEELSKSFDLPSLDGLLQAAAKWYAIANRTQPVFPHPDDAPWERLMERSLRAIADNPIADGDAWASAVESVQSRLGDLTARWSARPQHVWCHGDLHPGNALLVSGDDATDEDGKASNSKIPKVTDSRVTLPRVTLIDLALVHAGHWTEDACYLERLFWGHQDRLEGLDLVARLGEHLVAQGFTINPEDFEIAQLRRVLTAACVPAFLHREGYPNHLAHALEILQTDRTCE